ncbi:MAG: polysaccharide deacetylase family protein [Caldilineaceae bacterium]
MAVILMYHRISDEFVEPNWLAVSPCHFAQHLEHIRQQYHPIRLLELVDAIQNGSLRERAVAVTFDDGYSNNFTQALPLLEAAQIPATVFVTTGHIDSSCEFWWDDLAHLLLGAAHTPATLSLKVQERFYTWDTESVQQRQEARLALEDLIEPLPAKAKEQVLYELANWSGLKRGGRSAYRAMTKAELTQLAQSKYIDLGAHTVTHPILPTLSPEEQYAEIVNGRRNLETLVNQPVRTFAYPNGDFASETVKIVAEAGFTAACTTVRGCVQAGDDLFRLRRYSVDDWSSATFQQNLAAFFQNQS